MRDRTFTTSRWIAAAVSVLLVGILIPAALAAAGTFTDDDGSIFESDIEWLAEAGVTRGCNPSGGNTRFCPDDEVTRGQMAAFMRRFAQFLGAEDGVVSEAEYAASAGSAATARNADRLEGIDSAGFLRADEQAVDADHVDGLDSAAFVEHGTIVLRHATAELTPNEGSGITIHHYVGGNEVAGSGAVNIGLIGPAIIGGVGYDLASVEYCITAVNGNESVTEISVFEEGGSIRGSDVVNRDEPGCYSVAVTGNDAHAYDVGIAFAGTGSIRVAGIQSTWVPVP